MADSDWSDPLDTSHAARSGGRWNPPGSFGVLYLNATTDVARANVVRQLAGQPFGPEDLDPDSAPVLVSVQVPENSYVDAVTARGLRILGLPMSYPVDEAGIGVKHDVCAPIGAAAFRDGELGIACPTAADADGEELAWFAQPSRTAPARLSSQRFEEWFWA